MSHSDFHPNEKIEEFLQNELREYAPEANDALWAHIEARLPKSKRRPMLLWILLIAGSVLAFVEVLYHQSALFASPNASSLPTLERKETYGSTFAPVQQPQMQKQVFIAQTSEETQGFRKPILFSNTEIQTDPQAHTALPETTETIQGFYAPAAALTANHLDSSIYLTLKALKTTHLRTDWVAKEVSLPSQTTRPHPWQVGIEIAPLWIWQSGSMAMPHHAGALAFSEQQQGAISGWQQGISLAYALAPRWSLRTGVIQRSYTQEAAHRATLRLLDGICLNPSDTGPKEYEFQYTLQSGGTDSRITVSVAQVDTAVTMPDNEPFVLAMHTKRQSKDWVIPFSIQRAFSVGAFEGFVQGGVQLSIPGRTNVQVQHFSEECIDLCFASGRSPLLTLSEQRGAALSWLFGFGLKYPLASEWGLSFEPSIFGKKGQTGLAFSTGLHFKIH